MVGPLIAFINHLLMAFVNLWTGHDLSFPEMFMISCFGALAFSWVCMMAPMKSMKAVSKKEKAKPKAKGKASTRKKKQMKKK